MIENSEKLRELLRNVNFLNTLRDKNVRRILQKIRKNVTDRQALKGFEDDNPTLKHKFSMYVKVPSYSSKIEIFEKKVPIDRRFQEGEADDLFFFLISAVNAISEVNFECRYPNKKKEYIDYEILNPEEYEIPYVAALFKVENEQFFIELGDIAADILIINPYPPETQENIVHSSIANLKGKTKSDNLILTWDEIDMVDRQHIEIIKTLKNLEKNKVIKIEKLEYDLGEVDKNGKTTFKASILFTPFIPFNHKDCIKYGPIILDKSIRQVFYPKIPKKHIARFSNNMYYKALLITLEKEEEPKVIKDYELYQVRHTREKRPKELTSDDKDDILDIIGYLKRKLNNLDLYQIVDGGYKLTP